MTTATRRKDLIAAAELRHVATALELEQMPHLSDITVNELAAVIIDIRQRAEQLARA